jgi:hypothetical protein
VLALVNDKLYSSQDDGCRWAALGHTEMKHLVEGRGDVAYGWDDFTQIFAVSVSGARRVGGALDRIVALAVEPANPRHLRIVGRAHGVFDSLDVGVTWSHVGSVHARARSAAFDPGDWNHILRREDEDERVSVTRDGGASWTTSGGETSWGSWNPSVAVRLSSNGEAWVLADRSADRSTDGGLTFSRVGVSVDGLALRSFVGRQLDPDVLLVVQPHALAQLDVRRDIWTTVPLRIDVGQPTSMQDRGYWTPGQEVVDAATLLPGEPGALCLGIGSPGS